MEEAGDAYGVEGHWGKQLATCGRGFPVKTVMRMERCCRRSEAEWPRRSAQRSSTPNADPACMRPAQTPGLRYVAATEKAGPTTGHTQTSPMSGKYSGGRAVFRLGFESGPLTPRPRLTARRTPQPSSGKKQPDWLVLALCRGNPAADFSQETGFPRS